MDDPISQSSRAEPPVWFQFHYRDYAWQGIIQRWDKAFLAAPSTAGTATRYLAHGNLLDQVILPTRGLFRAGTTARPRKFRLNGVGNALQVALPMGEGERETGSRIFTEDTSGIDEVLRE